MNGSFVDNDDHYHDHQIYVEPAAVPISIIDQGTQRDKYFQYSAEVHQQAVVAVAHGHCRIGEVSTKYPLTNSSTVRRHAKLYNEHTTPNRPGRRQKLTDTQQRQLVDFIRMYDWSQIALSRDMVFQKAAEMAAAHGDKFKTSDGKPSHHWWIDFKHKWNIRGMKGVHKKDDPPTYSEVSHWFDYYTKMIHDHKYDASSIWNFDETGWSKFSGNPWVVVAKEDHRSYNTASVSGKKWDMHITLGACVAANAEVLPFLWISPGSTEHGYIDLARKIKDLGYMAHSKKGWITNYIFREWLEKVFVVHTGASPNNRKLLLVDNHQSRYVLDTMKYARDHGVDMLPYLPNATHFMQVLDCGIFARVKKVSGETWHDMVKTLPKSLAVNDIIAALHKNIRKAFTNEVVTSAWWNTGQWPPNKDLALKKEEFMKHMDKRQTIRIKMCQDIKNISSIEVIDSAEYKCSDIITSIEVPRELLKDYQGNPDLINMLPLPSERIRKKRSEDEKIQRDEDGKCISCGLKGRKKAPRKRKPGHVSQKRRNGPPRLLSSQAAIDEAEAEEAEILAEIAAAEQARKDKAGKQSGARARTKKAVAKKKNTKKTIASVVDTSDDCQSASSMPPLLPPSIPAPAPACKINTKKRKIANAPVNESLVDDDIDDCNGSSTILSEYRVRSGRNLPHRTASHVHVDEETKRSGKQDSSSSSSSDGNDSSSSNDRKSSDDSDGSDSDNANASDNDADDDDDNDDEVLQPSKRMRMRRSQRAASRIASRTISDNQRYATHTSDDTSSS